MKQNQKQKTEIIGQQSKVDSVFQHRKVEGILDDFDNNINANIWIINNFPEN